MTNVRRHGQGWQVRVMPFPAKTFPTKSAAEQHRLELLLRRAQGDRYSDAERTVGDEIDAWLVRYRAGGGARDVSIEFYVRCARIWEPFRRNKVAALRRAAVEDFILQRASEHRRSAQNELQFLKRVLKDARGRGQRVDEAVLSIPPIKAKAREGWALTVEQLYELASWFPEHCKRLVLLAGMVGARQRVWFEMTDDMLDLRTGALDVPAWLSKNGRAHRVYLTNLEVGLFREQLVARAAGASRVFPTVTGQEWNKSGFGERVWRRSVAAAARHNPGVGGRQSVFEGFTFHLLRHTACSLMARAGMDPAVAAERASHTDGGALFLRKYRHLSEGEKREQAMRLEALVQSHLDATWTDGSADAEEPHNEAEDESGRTWDRTRDLSRVKRALSR